MPRPLWSGSISFGLVNVPVKLFRAQSPSDIRFHQLHATDNVRIQQKRICPADGQEVPYEELVKGYELAPDRYVVIEQDELSALDPKATQTINIEDFVGLDQIDPLYYERGYHVVPDKRAERPYALLVAAMTETNRVGIARFVMRTKEYLCALRPKDGALVLSTMLFANEVVAADNLDVELKQADPPSEKELKMATSLIESLVVDFDPDRYHDEYREKVLALIDAKAEGGTVTQPADEGERAPVLDLMAALEASLAAAREPQGETTKNTKNTKRKTGNDQTGGKQKGEAELATIDHARHGKRAHG